MYIQVFSSTVLKLRENVEFVCFAGKLGKEKTNSSIYMEIVKPVANQFFLQ